MKIVFAGTPPFAATALAALHDVGHEIALVLTQPDRASGRGLRAQPSAVKQLAQKLGLDIAQPTSLKESPVQEKLARIAPDALIVAAYGLILPREILSLPRLGCINIHASLLPRWRGAAPIQRAILAGDARTGISIMKMDEGLDTGPVLLKEAIDIAPDDTAHTLHDKLAALGARLIVESLRRPPYPQPQDASLATYAAKIDKSEARIEWRDSACVNERKVRAFNPSPGAFTTFKGEPLKIWRARLTTAHAGKPGTILQVAKDAITVACGEDALEMLELQRAGGKRLAAAAFIAGATLNPGDELDAVISK